MGGGTDGDKQANRRKENDIHVFKCHTETYYFMNKGMRHIGNLTYFASCKLHAIIN